MPHRSTLRILLRGLVMAGIGTVIGLVAAFTLTRYLRDVLFGVAPTDPITYGLVVLSMLAVAALASAIPARRAAKVDPAIAFRSE